MRKKKKSVNAILNWFADKIWFAIFSGCIASGIGLVTNATMAVVYVSFVFAFVLAFERFTSNRYPWEDKRYE